jgi:hypothetical protein
MGRPAADSLDDWRRVPYIGIEMDDDVLNEPDCILFDPWRRSRRPRR